MKLTKIAFIMLIAVLALPFAGCYKPVMPKTLVDAQSNETMFVVPLVGENKENQAQFNSKDYYNQHKVATKQIQLEYRWLQTGRFEYDGDWVPSQKVIKVDRTPITVEFAVGDKTNAKKDADAIWIESADSVGFTIGFSVSAMIQEEDTATFLYRYQSATLATILSSEVRARIQQQAANFAAKYALDELRSKKNEMQRFIVDDVISFYKDRGITITTIAQFGGMTYENPDIQKAIDRVFIAQQEKNVANALLVAQKDVNAKSESATQQERANSITLATGQSEAIRLVAEATAKGNLLKAQADASGIEAVNKATKEAAENPLFLQVRKLDVQVKMYDKWNGAVPATLIAGSGVTPNIFLPNTPAEAAVVTTK